MIYRLNGYLFRETGIAFLFASVAVSCVVLFTQSFRFLSFVIDNAGTALVFFKLMGLLIPTFLPVIVPLGLGVSTLFIYHKLAVDSELVVMRAAGISPTRLALPALALAGLVTMLCYLLTTWIAPAANRELVNVQYSVRDNFSFSLIRPGAFNDLADGLTFYARARGNAGGELKDIIVHDVRRPDKPVTIIAQGGSVRFVDGEPQVIVYKGRRQEFDSETGHLSELNFDRYALDLSVLRTKTAARLPDPREQTMSELLNPPASKKERRRSLERIAAEFHQRLAFPLLTLSYAMIALATVLAGEFNRRGMAKRIVLGALSIVAVQAAALSMGSLIGRSPWLTPALYVLALGPALACWMLLRMPDLPCKNARHADESTLSQRQEKGIA